MCAASEDANPKSLLLLGATGNGKSTLGNYLIDPSDEHIDSIGGEVQTFITATSNLPETKQVKSSRVRDNNFKHIAIVDTPGLNDSGEKDLAHMIDLVKNLREIKTVTACAIVCKIDGKIDETFKMTIKYYSNLLPQIFENNVFIVLTKVEEGERAEKARRKMGIVLEEYMEKVQDRVVELTKLRFKPEVFTIDSLPLDDSTREASLKTRFAILDYVSKMSSIGTSKLRIAKTPVVKQKDREMLDALGYQLTGYNDQLIEKERGSAAVLTSLEHMASSQADKLLRLKRCQQKLNIYDTDDLIVDKQWSLDRSLFGNRTATFEVKPDYAIVKIDKWDNGQLEWSIEGSFDEGTVRGEISGEFMKQLHAMLTISTYKRHVYAEEIATLTEEESSLLADLETLDQEIIKTCSIKNSTNHEEIEALQRKIAEVKKRREACEGDYMTIDEAEKRLAELESSA